MNFNKAVIECRLDSPAGARGIAQFMPGTARSWKVDPCNPKSAINGQARFMRALLDKFNQREDLALAAYNSGPARVARLQRVPRIPETLRYVKFIQLRKVEIVTWYEIVSSYVGFRLGGWLYYRIKYHGVVSEMKRQRKAGKMFGGAFYRQVVVWKWWMP